jgi:hypothetical protein
MSVSQPPAYQEEVIEEDGPPAEEARTVQRIRANSTIMQLNKLLGE